MRKRRKKKIHLSRGLLRDWNILNVVCQLSYWSSLFRWLVSEVCNCSTENCARKRLVSNSQIVANVRWQRKQVALWREFRRWWQCELVLSWRDIINSRTRCRLCVEALLDFWLPWITYVKASLIINRCTSVLRVHVPVEMRVLFCGHKIHCFSRMIGKLECQFW